MQGKLTVFFRFDDFSETSPSAVEAGLVDALEHNRMCATFAVIPAVTEGSYHVPGERGTLPLGPEKIRFLRRAVDNGTVDVALHGCNHRSVSASSPHSEFVGLTVQEQIAKIQSGLQLFRHPVNVDASVFVPPWNNYDDGTLEALSQQGLACISANRYGLCREGSLRFAPITTDIKGLRQAIVSARDSRDTDLIIGVLLHPYDFEESGDPRAEMSCRAFDGELRWLAQQPDVTVVSVSTLSQNHTLGAARYRANQPLWFESVFPPFVRTTNSTPFFRSERGARRIKAWRTLTTVAVYVAATLAGVAIGHLAWAWLERPATILITAGKAVAGMLVLGLLIRTAVRRELYFRTMLALLLLCGVLISGCSPTSIP